MSSFIPLPSPQSLSYRAHLASLISPLKRVRPRVPFYQLAAHRIPTLWTLYRGLLRNATGVNIRFRITMRFRHYQHLTSPRETHKQLRLGHKWLDIFVKSNQGDEKLQAILRRYDMMIGAKREKERWKRIIHEAFAWEEKLRRRPILTGAYLRPSLFNRPLPRLKPQPTHISMMIYKRRTARERRLETQAILNAWRNDLRHEHKFELDLAARSDQQFHRIFHDITAWDKPLHERQMALQATFELDTKRQSTPYPEPLLAAIKQARREKIANKTKERERERRGEVLRCTIRRQRQGPPAHVLRMMTPEQRRMDRIARSVSEVGYAGMVKLRVRSRTPR